MALQAVVSQQLLPTTNGEIHPAYEIMVVNSAISNLIRENKIYQIESQLQTGAAQGMITMDMSIFELARKNIITKETAKLYAIDPPGMAQRLSGQVRTG